MLGWLLHIRVKTEKNIKQREKNSYFDNYSKQRSCQAIKD